ncbi:hypothetical protein AB0D04_19225 [Streptomyces sp. NPDC048483]|uniref:hypothetical protein n=1 Tax=Streptomyces sp. NPDC048483 TaxID=3154927 RepID=UPI003412AEB4
MKIAKTAAGVVGVALALGAASPALAASGPRGGEKKIVDGTTVKRGVHGPLSTPLSVGTLVGSLGGVADKLNAKNATNPTKAKIKKIIHAPKAAR